MVVLGEYGNGGAGSVGVVGRVVLGGWCWEEWGVQWWWWCWENSTGESREKWCWRGRSRAEGSGLVWREEEEECSG